jgi:integrase/recombinase XerD
MKNTKDLQIILDAPGALSPIATLSEIPEEDIWLAKQKSKRTRRAYKLDVTHFMRTLMIRSYEELRQVDHRAVIAWERIMREIDEAAPSTVRRRLAALSSLFKHLVRHGHAAKNPVSEVERPAINREEGTTLAFSKDQARRLLDLPDESKLEGLRDRAILAVGLQVGLRRAEIASLKA